MSQPIIVTVTGETVDEIRSKLLNLAREFGHDDRQESLPLASAQASAPEVKAAREANPNLGMHEARAQVETEKRGRHPKSCACEKCVAKSAPAKEEPKAAPEAEVKPAEKAAKTDSVGKPATKDQMVAALQSLLGKRNMPAVTETLAKFGAKKASEVKDTDFAAVIAECEAQVSA